MFESSNYFCFCFCFFTLSVSLYHNKPQNQRNPQTQEQKLKTVVVLSDSASVLVKPHHLRLVASPPLAGILGGGLVSLSWVLLGRLNNYLISTSFFPTFPWCYLSTLSVFQTSGVNVNSPSPLLCYHFSRCCFTFTDAYPSVSSYRVLLGNYSWRCLTISSLEDTTSALAHGKIAAFLAVITPF